MKVINLGKENSILNKFMKELRDVNIQGDRMRFRKNKRRIGHIEAYDLKPRVPLAIFITSIRG